MSRATHTNLPSGSDDPSAGWRPRIATGVIVLADGALIEGFGVGATGSAVGEICFNTAMTGYEEILTDPSYAAQIITFTFPHIGIVGTAYSPVAAGSPGPLERTTPSGLSVRISSALAVAGTTVTAQPQSLRSLRMLRLVP